MPIVQVMTYSFICCLVSMITAQYLHILYCYQRILRLRLAARRSLAKRTPNIVYTPLPAPNSHTHTHTLSLLRANSNALMLIGDAWKLNASRNLGTTPRGLDRYRRASCTAGDSDCNSRRESARATEGGTQVVLLRRPICASSDASMWPWSSSESS
ncbi:hypothetical protein C8Q78DRAFT_249538 [Trametes maxima]|nr:hypothetical protein C8Q78DRAFT_249538 [Trametes maxima]